MMLLVQDLGATRVLAQSAPLPIDLTAEAIPQGVAASGGTVTVGDSVFGRTTGVTTWNHYHLASSVSGDQDVVLSNLSPAVGSLDGDIVSRVADGFCTIRATRGGSSQTRQLDMRQTVGSTLDVLQSFTNNSVADRLTDALMALVTDASPGLYYSVKNHATATYARNSACWGAGLNLSAISVASDRIDPAFSTRSCGTAVTARHVIGAGHNGWLIGTKLRFATPDGTVHTRTLTGRSDFGDVVVATLDSALPAGITPIKICGDWIVRNAISSNGLWNYNLAGAAVHLDQHGYLKWTLLGGPSGASISGTRMATINGTVFSAFDGATCWSRDSVLNLSPAPAFATSKLTHVQNGLPGDSGLPLMALTASGLGILWTWQFQTGGPPVWEPGLIDAMIAAADTHAGVSTGLTVSYLADPTA